MIEEIAYHGWKNNVRLRGPKTELIVTLDVGPRIIRYARHDQPNVFVEMGDQIGGSEEEEWMIRGGHRFWTAPEADHCYEPDNHPASWRKLSDTALEVVQTPSQRYSFQKTLRIEMLADETVRLTHRLSATGDRPLQVTPWALSVMEPGGTAVIPQPKVQPHPTEFPPDRVPTPEDFLPNRELVLWPFTDLTDGRYRFSDRFLRVSYKKGLPATKIGLKFPTGWIAYENRGFAFAKHFARDPEVPYPDRGVNLEIFTNDAILELESLAPLVPLAPGESREHVEHWVLRPSTESLREESAAVAFFAALPTINS